MSAGLVRTSDPTRVARNSVYEVEFVGLSDHDDPWAEIELDVEFVDPDGVRRIVPAFWAGGRAWRVRYSSPLEGTHRYRTLVNGPDGTGLEGHEGDITVTGYAGTNPLLLHGGPTAAADTRHLVHADGEPFFWLADTWWSAMTERFRWPDVFQTIADDRAEKGFTVVQLVAGLVPEFVPFTRWTLSEGGQPWEDNGKGRINPAFYSVPDQKIDYLVEKGIAPCIVGGWGHWAALLGRERLLKHWRYVVARYGAYPVIWCIAGEVDLQGTWEQMSVRRIDEASLLTDMRAVLDVKEDPRTEKEQIAIWQEVAKMVGKIDPFNRMRTAHPTPPKSYSTGDLFESRDSFELELMQVGHDGRKSVPPTMVNLRRVLAAGDKPVLIGECSYEGIFGSNWHDVQRLLFWTHMLSGSAGHTYGTMAISSFNSKDDPHVPISRVSDHYWQDAINWLGSSHVGAGKRILERFPWWQLEPRQDAVEPHANADDWFLPYAAKLPGDTTIVYLPSLAMTSEPGWGIFATLTLGDLKSGATYRATWVDPRTGKDHSTFSFTADDTRHTLRSNHYWLMPTGEDWLLVVRPGG